MSISKAYDHWSDSYDDVDNKTRDLDQRATITTLGLYTFGKVLEMGCGTGKNTLWLEERSESVTGFDFSEGMLAKAREKIQRESVTFQQADLTEAWPAANDTADLITFNLILEHIADLDHIYRQAYAKLKKGGKLFISELHPFKQYLGSKARFEMESGTQELEVFTHHVSEFMSLGSKQGFRLLELREWWDEDDTSEVPRLLTLLWEK
ncbi:MAG: methyltransferase domain-containing protein [Saprospiraceae bacterium]|nr:methyltransferase domain-containing protein [Lewinella sp.]